MPRPGRWQGALPSCTQLHRTHGTAGGLPLRKAKISGSRTAWQHDRQGKLQEELQARRIISRRIIYGNETFRRGPVTPGPPAKRGPQQPSGRLAAIRRARGVCLPARKGHEGQALTHILPYQGGGTCVGRYHALSRRPGNAGGAFQTGCRRPCADGDGEHQVHVLPRGAEGGVD